MRGGGGGGGGGGQTDRQTDRETIERMMSWNKKEKEKRMEEKEKG